MKNNQIKFFLVLFVSMAFYSITNAQDRIKPPKKRSKINKVDIFVNKSFEIYNVVYKMDSLTKKGIDINEKYEDAFLEAAQNDIKSLYEQVPDMVEEISNAKFLKQAKATINLNKAKKALKFCMLYAKDYLLN